MKKVMVILISILSAFIIMSSGFGKWQKELRVLTDITVMPDSRTIDGLIAEREKLILEAQRIEEERLLEEQKALEAQKILEEQKLSGEQVNVEELEEPQEMFNIEIEVLNPQATINNEIYTTKEKEAEEIIEDTNNSEETSLQEEDKIEIIDSDNQE